MGVTYHSVGSVDLRAPRFSTSSLGFDIDQGPGPVAVVFPASCYKGAETVGWILIHEPGKTVPKQLKQQVFFRMFRMNGNMYRNLGTLRFIL